MQILGAIFGSLLAQGLVPNDHLWQNYKSRSIRSATSSDAGSGCFFPVSLHLDFLLSEQFTLYIAIYIMYYYDYDW